MAFIRKLSVVVFLSWAVASSSYLVGESADVSVNWSPGRPIIWDWHAPRVDPIAIALIVVMLSPSGVILLILNWANHNKHKMVNLLIGSCLTVALIHPLIFGLLLAEKVKAHRDLVEAIGGLQIGHAAPGYFVFILQA
jgi:hypothetical protein